ncbi:FYVE, RhoGEF and PH domain-containing protein 6 isoform X2 [Microtus oregoni]|uniref:FYVE, RhoGEF and PH domain-containing protein 6 isoform X2 n=1 Tax=Microtus oregoni TaxID=111838 RepID=UPI001BB128D6|nr:FYVE, RhoGEF and PH domain-containing protein 6 isoform X2 [Microtus oregoni]
MTSVAELKKPPLAPKPKLVGTSSRPSPPPIAPKPDIVNASVPRLTKKTKPAIAPKPKALTNSAVQDIKQSPSKKPPLNLEEREPELPESTDTFNRKDVGDAHSDYILPTCSCGSACTREEPGNRGSLCAKQLVLEPLGMKENLENSKNSESSLTAKRRTRWDLRGEKGRNQSGVILKAGVLEEKLKEVLTQQQSPRSTPKKHRSPPNTEINGDYSCSRQIRIDLADLPPSLSRFEKVPAHHSCHPQPPRDESQNLETCEAGSAKSSSHSEFCELDDKKTPPDGTSKKPDVTDLGPLEIHLLPHTSKFPIPKPRKTHAARLLRQKCVDTPSESAEEPENSNNGSSCLLEDSLKNNQVSVLHQNVLYNQGQVDKVKAANKRALTSDPKSDRQDSVRQEISSSEKVTPSSDADSILRADSTAGDAGTLPAVEREASLQCRTQSPSLPKQAQLSCTEHPPTTCDVELSVPQVQKESSSRVVPKKPQRHSLPAAGVLKKAASEEHVEKNSYSSSRATNSEKGLQRNHPQPLGPSNRGVSPSFSDTPNPASEKPVWKLPHPILPFPGSPESLKGVTLSLNNEPASSLTKPRAKSLSAVDMDRCDKPCKDPPKRTSFKKLINVKLSIGFIKSDFQKFRSKSCQPVGATTGPLLSREPKGLESDWQGLVMGDEKRSKPSKAYSAENCSLGSPKGKSRGQTRAANGQRAESLDDQMLSRDSPSTRDYAPEYENVRHYEEIPEYENLPFVLAGGKAPELGWQTSSRVEDTDANLYEVQEPYDAPDGQPQLDPRRPPSSSATSQERHDGPHLGLGDLPSDEEVINSSDEDDVSSESSKGEPDLLEDKQDFRDAVAHASRQLGKPVIEDRILNQILYYLPQLYELNRDLLKELEERMLSWNEQPRIADIFVKKGPYLKMYSTYIKEFDKNIALLDEQCKKNPGFAAVVREFEMSPRCANLALKHYLLKPVQRIPQYRLLLTDYLKNLLEDSADHRDTHDALAVVIEVANHANDTMKQGDNFQKLMQIQYSLSGHQEIVQPGRVFLKEGTLMKLSRKVMQPRMFFLFNDALLYTTPMQSGMYKLNNMLSLAGMKVRKPTQEAYQNELKIESVERSFILSASSATERDEWLEAISRAIEEYAKKRTTFCPSRSLDEDLEKKEEVSPLGSKAPIWIPDTRATMCMICTSEFTLTWRRHHCRACGKIVCQACSSNKYGLDYLKRQLARVCEHCFQELQKLDHQLPPRVGSPGNHKSPSSALSSVLHSIPSGRKQKKIPAALKEVSANTEDSTMSGYLYRSKGSKKPWKHLWFVIKNKVLYTYAASEDVAALESQPLLGFTVTQVRDESSESRVFQLLHKGMVFYVFKADDAHSTQKWIEAFQEGTVL